MAALPIVEIPPLQDDNTFERLCLDLWRRMLNDPHTQLNGRTGQEQSGVDIFGRRDGRHWVGIQCKVRNRSNLSVKEIDAEIHKARSFNPRLTEYIIATTMSRDKSLQEHARRRTDEYVQHNLFAIAIVFWEDIQLELLKESNLDILQRYYAHFFIDATKHGFAMARLINVEIGVGKHSDTQYDLLVGRIPAGEHPGDPSGLNYYRGTYFLVNFHEAKGDTFPMPCFASDLEHVIRSKRDAFIIARWLTSQKDIDRIIHDNEDFYTSNITIEDYEEFRKSISDCG